jgi:hypothetical protein
LGRKEHMATTAIEKITTRIRPVPTPPAKPVEEILSTHAATCPQCSRETRVGLGAEATLYGGCVHVRGIQQQAGNVSITFEAGA